MAESKQIKDLKADHAGLEQQVESFRKRIAELEEFAKRVKAALGGMGQSV